MELTTSYQKLGEAYLGNSYGNLYIRIYAKYSEQDVTNNRTKVQYQARAYYSGSSYILDQQSYGNVNGTSANQVNYSRSSSYLSGETVLGTTEAWVTHNADGTMSISASAYLNFPNWGWSNTASGTATLPNLHKPPEIGIATMVEFNQTLISLNVPDTTVVANLSQKRITLNATAYDDAALSYRLEHYNTNYNLPLATDYQSSNVFNADYKRNPVSIDNNGKAKIVQKIKDSLNGLSSSWLYVDINGQTQEPDGIPYINPFFERTSTHIKRLSGNGVVLTDNKAVLNLVASIYKAYDIIGNNNSISEIGYKIWKATGESEPANYTPITTATMTDGQITVEDLEINNIEYTSVYNYKIIITDRYGKSAKIDDGIVPTGVSVWTEYTNRVDFLKLTVGGYNPFEYSENETICGVWLGKPLYRKVIRTTTYAGINSISKSSVSNDLKDIIFLYGRIIQPSTNNVSMIPYHYDNIDFTHSFWDAPNNEIKLFCGNSYGFGDTYLVCEYTKITD